MKCPNCSATLKKIPVKIAGAKNKVTSYQCPKCDYFSFEQSSSNKVIEELRETPLQIKQKIVKLSHDRLGIYFNSNIVRSLDLKKGNDVYISVPDKRHLLLEIKE